VVARAGRVAAALGIDEPEVHARLAAARTAGTLAEWLQRMQITYLNRDLASANLPAEGFDAIFSSNVLEHVTPGGLRSIHGESWRLLRRGGRIVHRFNPQDHFSTIDGSITGANFLQFSESEWEWLGGSGLSYHNRLRCPQHRTLVLESGFDVTLERRRADPRARRAIESGDLRVHSDYAAFDPVELTDDYMWIVAAKSLAPRADASGAVRDPHVVANEVRC
jgi:hypothetical protein